MAERITRDITTGIGTLSFPHIFRETASTNDKGEKSYDIQIIIPKSQKDDLRALLGAIKAVGEGKWGENWRKVRQPLRDGDKEKGELTEDGSTKGDKYPERLGCYFLNARSTKPVAVVDRTLTPIDDSDAIYGGCKGKISVTFYPYSTSGNHGIGVALNGVQKIADGESFGGGKPSVESMFDLLEEDDDIDLDAEAEAEPEPTPAKKAAAKKATAKPKAKPEPEPVADEEDDLSDLDVPEGEDDMFDDL